VISLIASVYSVYSLRRKDPVKSSQSNGYVISSTLIFSCFSSSYYIHFCCTLQNFQRYHIMPVSSASIPWKGNYFPVPNFLIFVTYPR
jgi:hypothetical protein